MWWRRHKPRHAHTRRLLVARCTMCEWTQRSNNSIDALYATASAHAQNHPGHLVDLGRVW